MSDLKTNLKNTKLKPHHLEIEIETMEKSVSRLIFCKLNLA